MQNKAYIKIILCRTWSPGNVGSAVRAMKNFGFTDLVSCCQINFDPAETAVMAAGAADMLDRIRFSSDLPAETAECQVVYAFTGRKRKHYQVLSPREMATEISSLPEDSRIALLFGNETNGLNNTELDLADKIVMIPAEENYSSLNLSMAVLLALYELQTAFKHKAEKQPTETFLSHQEKERLITEIISATQKIIDKEVNNPQIDENIRHFFKKSGLNIRESRFIHSLFRLILRRLHIRL